MRFELKKRKMRKGNEGYVPAAFNPQILNVWQKFIIENYERNHEALKCPSSHSSPRL